MQAYRLQICGAYPRPIRDCRSVVIWPITNLLALLLHIVYWPTSLGPWGACAQGHHGPLWALACHCFQVFVGQLELISNVSALVSWANARLSLGSPPANKILCGPTRQSCGAACFLFYGPMRGNGQGVVFYEMGPCGGLGAIAFRRLWAN